MARSHVPGEPDVCLGPWGFQIIGWTLTRDWNRSPIDCRADALLGDLVGWTLKKRSLVSLVILCCLLWMDRL